MFVSMDFFVFHVAMESNQEANAKFVELRNAFEFPWLKTRPQKRLDAVVANDNVCSYVNTP